MGSTLGLVSLGCAKNRVDTEGIAGLFRDEGFTIVSELSNAEIIIINTCCFVASAQEESVDVILETTGYKDGKCRLLVVIGCLVQRYGRKLKKLIPEVDLWLGSGDYHRLPVLLAEASKNRGMLVVCEPGWLMPEGSRRLQSTPNGWAFLKIAEGCDNRCSYCVIPEVRGSYRSRSMSEVISEANELLARGVREINLIAQDSTNYGEDFNDGTTFIDLLKSLDQLSGDYWLRILYGYPSRITDELLEFIAHAKHVIPYLDIPFQHVHPDILKAMGRKGEDGWVLKRIKEIRKILPRVVIRTTFITGFPGETEEAFATLLRFISEARLDWVGVFPYSREPGTPAYRLQGQIHASTRKKRARILLEKQADITSARLQEFLGQELKVLVEEVSETGGWGRSYREAPEVDGCIYFSGNSRLNPGDFCNIRITGLIQPYDLVGELVEDR
jgi:ribosomal protein S12 methylthiotransferase